MQARTKKLLLGVAAGAVVIALWRRRASAAPAATTEQSPGAGAALDAGLAGAGEGASSGSIWLDLEGIGHRMMGGFTGLVSGAGSPDGRIEMEAYYRKNGLCMKMQRFASGRVLSTKAEENLCSEV